VAQRYAARELPEQLQLALYHVLLAQFQGNRECCADAVPLGQGGGRSAERPSVREGSYVTLYWNRLGKAVAAHFDQGRNVTLKALAEWRALKKGRLRPEEALKGRAPQEDEFPRKVSRLSAWLASFNANDFAASVAPIEVPGQYDRYDGSAAPPAATSVAGGRGRGLGGASAAAAAAAAGGAAAAAAAGAASGGAGTKRSSQILRSAVAWLECTFHRAPAARAAGGRRSVASPSTSSLSGSVRGTHSMRPMSGLAGMTA
jgi:hypothetical protein